MKRTVLLAAFGIVAVIAVVAFARSFFLITTTPHDQDLIPGLPGSPLDATYRIEDEEVALRNGVATKELVLGAASQAVTRVYGKPVFADLTGDNVDDAALILTQNTGGSGTFFYAVVAIRDGEGYLGSDAVYLGDRITVDDVSIEHEITTVQYRTYKEEQSFADEPARPVARHFTLAGGYLTEVAVEEGAMLMRGTYHAERGTATFTDCDGTTYLVDDSSRARAALDAIYKQRTVVEKDDNVFAVIVATPVEREGNEAHLAAARVASAPKEGACSPSGIDLGSAATAIAMTSDMVEAP